MSSLLSFAQEPSLIDSGDTAWVMASAALVLLMIIGLGLFYTGLVRSKNALNTFMMCIAAIAVSGVSWAVIGYSLTFAEGNPIIGGFDYAFMQGVDFEPLEGQTIPHLVFFAFQGTFCMITAALVSGAIVERMRFGTYLVFIALWSVAVYPVLAHWVFGGGWLAEGGTLDFAGGVPVEMGSGFSGLAAAIIVGARKDFGRQALLPHNSVYILLGAGLLWFGWFGFNGGSGLGINDSGVLAFTNTLLCPAAALLAWFALDHWRGRRITALGAATAIIVGAVAITPAGAFISPAYAILLGALAALPSYAVIVWRTRKGIDETLDVLAAHGTAGFFGILFIGLFAQINWNGAADGLFYGDANTALWQSLAALSAPLYAFGATALILIGLGKIMPLRVTPEEESIGLDVSAHGEEAYLSGEGAILVGLEEAIDAEAIIPAEPETPTHL